MDIKSKEERSRNMAKIRAKDTKPEVFVRSLLHRNGLRFRVADARIFGKPDLYFSKKQVAIFIHGCYWHRHPDCKYAYTPKSNVDFWQKKFDANVTRDKMVKSHLLESGIRILIIWECTIKKMMRDDGIAKNLLLDIIAFLLNSEIDYLEL